MSKSLVGSKSERLKSLSSLGSFETRSRESETTFDEADLDCAQAFFAVEDASLEHEDVSPVGVDDRWCPQQLDEGRVFGAHDSVC